MKISKKGAFIKPGSYSRKHQLNGDPDGPIDGNAEDIESALCMGCNGFTEKLDILKSNEIGKNKVTRKDLDLRMLLGIGYLCRNYQLGNLNSHQVKQFESMMLDLSLLIGRLEEHNVKIPKPVIEQLNTMDLLNEK